jgi:hypothetical protein
MMSFFNRGNRGRNNRGRGNWNRGPRRPRFSIHFYFDTQELNHLFQDGLFNWIGQGLVQPRPKRPPFHPQNIPIILVPPHVSLQPEFPANDGWQEIDNPVVSHHRGCPNLSLPPPPPIIPNIQIAPIHSPIQSSHASKRLKTDVPHVQDKGKVVASPSSPSNDSSKSMSSYMHLKDDRSHVISEIQPQGLNQPKDTSENSKGGSSDKIRIASQSGKYGF